MVSDKSSFETAMMQGRLPADLMNEVSDAMHKAMQRGMEPDECVCADYLRGLSEAVLARIHAPMPEVER